MGLLLSNSDPEISISLGMIISVLLLRKKVLLYSHVPMYDTHNKCAINVWLWFCDE